MAYSLMRWSTGQQDAGDSERRQADAAVRIAARLGMPLATTVYADRGVSGSKVAITDRPGVKTFLEAVENGEIAKGSYLVVEAFDRVSRQLRDDKVITLLRDLLEQGIGIATEKHTFAPEVEPSTTDLLMMFLELRQAAEFSQHLAKRVRAAQQAKRQRMRATGQAETCRVPQWIKATKTGVKNAYVWTYELHPERAPIIKAIIDQVSRGVPLGQVVRGLQDVPSAYGKSWSRAYLRRLLASPALYGEWQGTTLPALITKDEFDRLHLGRQRRGGTRGTPRSWLAGSLTCSLCGALVRRNTSATRGAGGKRLYVPYLLCGRVKELGPDVAGHAYLAVRYEPVERALREALESILGDVPAVDTATQEELEQARVNLDVAQDHLEETARVLEARPSMAGAELLQRLEAEVQVLSERVEMLQVAVAGSVPAAVDRRVAALRSALEGMQEFAEAPQGPQGLARVLRELGSAFKAVFSSAVLDITGGSIVITWRHAPSSEVDVMVAWPRRES
jgi:DNA invertase Pin-like site-specific DNA recombinase